MLAMGLAARSAYRKAKADSEAAGETWDEQQAKRMPMLFAAADRRRATCRTRDEHTKNIHRDMTPRKSKFRWYHYRRWRGAF